MSITCHRYRMVEGACSHMRDVLYTRLLLWKRKWLGMLFWLLLPIIGTYGIVSMTDTIQDDSKVPIGIVLEEQTDVATEFLQSIKHSDLVYVEQTTEENALSKLEKHELDSVFIIHDGFEDAILKGNRNHILSSYYTELSFAYSPVKEMIVSLAQEETGRSKAAHIVLNLSETYLGKENWSWEEIRAKSVEVQQEENLLNTRFQYSSPTEITKDTTLISWNSWGLWAILSLLATLFVSDWVVREKTLPVSTRYYFLKLSRLQYFLQILVLYILLFFLVDLVSVVVFTIFLDESISLQLIINLVTFRIMLVTLSFSIASLFTSRGAFYGVSFLFVLLLATSSGTILPIDGFELNNSLIRSLNPIQAFVAGKPTLLWLFSSLIFLLLVLKGKERTNA